MYIDSGVENNEKNCRKSKVFDYTRIWKYQNISVKGYTPNWSQLLWLESLKMQYHRCMKKKTLIFKKSFVKKRV